MTDAVPNSRSGSLVSAAHWGGFLVWCALSMIAVGVLAAFALLAISGPKALLDPDLAKNATFLGMTTIVSISAMAAGGVLGAILLPTEANALFGFQPSPAAVAEVHGFRRFHPAWLLAAVVGTAGIGFLPGWFVEQLMQFEALEAMAQSMQGLTAVLADPSAPGWIWMIIAVGITAPVCEELMFRGYLWRAAEVGMPPVAVWLATSLLFATYHMNPVHILGVLPVGLFFGWLRWMSGSIWPSMLAHFVNNSLAIGLTLVVGENVEGGLGLSLVALVVGIAAAVGSWKLAGAAPTEAP